MASKSAPVNEDTLITIKVSFDDCTKRVKLPLRDLGANVLPLKLRHILCIAPDQPVVFERFSDSAGGYVVLDSTNPAVFKTLIRAAKAKLKLRLRASAPSSAPTEESTTTSKGPVIARTPAFAAPPRDSTALDQRSLGPGIFEFRDALASEKKADDEAPVPHPFTFSAPPAHHGSTQTLPLRARSSIDINKGPWSVFCNACDGVMTDVHYHCSICDSGDFDLCESCVREGKLCPGEGHWLIKRSIQDGKVVSSTTERIAPKPMETPLPNVESEKEVPGAFTDDAKTLSEEPMRTCNACVITLPDRDFVTCVQCDDYDLCLNCHAALKHGHHPGHHFKRAVDGTELTLAEEALLPAGRNVRHNAICDGCDKPILGVRHKCFDCPDFDYCSGCYQNARHSHPRHRFATIYDQLKGRPASSVSHHGIYCDGPLCKGKSHQTYIQGVRYKCVVCHDTDFCEACEALPMSFHNKTHPLVKFKTPVNHLTITTESENKHGVVRKLGDRESNRHLHSPALTSPSKQASNVTAPVKTVADIRPSPQADEKKVEETKVEEKVEAKAEEKTEEKKADEPAPAAPPAKLPASLLHGNFVSDRISDGTVVTPDTRFMQVWTIRNPGPHVWPAGCSVRFVGGDNMLNVDNAHAAAVSDIAEATESNVIGREVLPGEQVGFGVTMKAPSREGKCISYWRLKTPDGEPFGHRLWCDINVKTTATDAPKVAADVPDTAKRTNCYNQPNMQSYYALYKERMNALKSHLDQARAEEQIKQAHVLEAPVSPQELPAESQRLADASAVAQEKQEPEVAEPKQNDEELQGSQMVFPTLDKESPASSTYQSFSGSSVSKKHEDAEQALQSSQAHNSVDNAGDDGFEDISDDLEVLSANDEEESEDDGFLTDDDYDILDASDQETIASMK